MHPVDAAAPVILRSGENALITQVYWIRRSPCESRLTEVTGVSPTSSNFEGLELSLVRGQTTAPWQCPGITVPAAFVVIRQTRNFTAPERREAYYIVSYQTLDGPQSSRHSTVLEISPVATVAPPR